ncbi:MAG: S8 family serine peptidase [Parashewanella sp.]
MKTALALAVSAALIPSSIYAVELPQTAAEFIQAEEQLPAQQASNKNAHTVINNYYIVELASEAMLPFQTNRSLTSSSLSRSKVFDHKQKLQQEKQAFAQAMMLQMPQAQIVHQYQLLFNGVSISGNALTINKLMSMPNVKAVYPDYLYRTALQESVPLINAPSLWEKLSILNPVANAGKGIKIAVIDSGIRPENPMFSDDNFTTPSNLPTDDYCRTTSASFCNNKLIAARWIEPTFNVCEDEHMSPLGYLGHGSHVSGIAAGNPVEVSGGGKDYELSGVAPAAYLMMYKALYSDENCSGGVGSTSMLLAALEAAVNDGADVINNSWGGGAGTDPNTSFYKQAIDNAVAAGIVVVSAAGNNGDAAKTIICPGCVESGITVANTSKADIVRNSSSRGPNGDSSFLKPDIAAPGTQILSAFSPEENDTESDFTFLTGTSMSSPHVAGGAALLKQLHPSWTPQEIKSALTSTSQYNDIINNDDIATAFDIGAGRIDLKAASEAVLTFDKVSLVSNSCVGSCQLSLQVTNKSEQTTNWQLTSTSNSLGIAASPTTLQLNASSSKTVLITVNANQVQTAAWRFGRLLLTRLNSDNDNKAHIPIVVYAEQDSGDLSISTSKDNYTSSEELSITNTFINNKLADEVTLTATLPAGTQLTNKDKVNITTSNAQQSSLHIDEENQRIIWKGKLNTAEGDKTPSGKVTISYKAKITMISLGETHQVTMDEDKNAVVNLNAIPVTEQKAIKFSVTSGENTLNAQKNIITQSSGELIDIAIDTPIQNGTVNLNNTILSYQPNQHYFGADSLSFSATDSEQTAITQRKISFTINPVNDAPEIQTQDVTATTGNTITLTSTATDVENDPITYSWRQKSGVQIPFNENAQHIQVTPSVAGTYTFGVTANDGKANSKEADVKLTVNEPSSSSGGSVGWIILNLIGLILLRSKAALQRG